MKIFIWTVSIIFALEMVSKIVLLAMGYAPQRTAKTLAFDVFTLIALLLWALWVLRGAA